MAALLAVGWAANAVATPTPTVTGLPKPSADGAAPASPGQTAAPAPNWIMPIGLGVSAPDTAVVVDGDDGGSYIAAASAAAPTSVLSLAQAQSIAARANFATIAARFEIDASQARRLAAGLWENPTLQLSVGNIILGKPFDQDLTGEALANFHPRLFDQRNISIELSQQIDVWLKRRAQVRAASAKVQQAQAGLADVMRVLRFEVAEAFGQVVRGQAEVALAQRSHQTYQQTLQLCRSRRRLGDISQAELDKIELEELRYIDQDISAQGGLRQARLRLAAALALADDQSLPQVLQLPAVASQELDEPALQRQALAQRPDLAAAHQAAEAAELQLQAERRQRLPDLSLSVGYTNSKFQISGDNPHALGLGLALPLPLFDRNQGDIAQAQAELGQAQAYAAALDRQVRREVAQAVALCRQCATRLSALHPQMQARAERAQAVAARAWRAGSTSLLEFLEADRTFLELQRDVLEARDDWRQAAFALDLAVAQEP